MSATLTVPKGGDLSATLRIAKNPRTRISDYAWRAHLRTEPSSVSVALDLTQTNGGLTIVDDLAGDIALSLNHDQTAALAVGSYVLDLMATNSVTGLVEFTDAVALTVTLPITRPNG